MLALTWFLAALATFGVALAWLPAPFAWPFAVLALGSVRSAVSAATKGARRAWTVAATLATLLSLGELVLPGPEAPRPACAHDAADRPSAKSPFHGEIGFGPVPSRAIPSHEIGGGGQSFDGVYTIDDHGLRVRFPGEGGGAVLFFGGSYTFGQGVADDETTAWLTGEALDGELVAYNFGYCGHGPHQMLAALQCGRVERIVEEEPRHVVFLLIDNHIRRVVGRTGWAIHDPRFELRGDGTVERNGRQCDPRPAPGPGRRLLERSAVWRKATAHTTRAHADTLIGVLATTRDELERRFPGCRLHVLLWDRSTWKSRHMLRGLREVGIDVHPLTEVLPGLEEDRDAWFLSEEDHHPNAGAHARLADFVVDLVRRSGD